MSYVKFIKVSNFRYAKSFITELFIGIIDRVNFVFYLFSTGE